LGALLHSLSSRLCYLKQLMTNHSLVMFNCTACLANESDYGTFDDLELECVHYFKEIVNHYIKLKCLPTEMTIFKFHQCKPMQF